MSYKLVYFDMAGRAEVIRVIFAAAGVKFTDERIQFPEFSALKPTLLWEQLPILHAGDKTLAQSTTICRFLARKFKLTGADEWEAAKCDEYVDSCNDLFEEWVKFYFEKDESQKALKKEGFVKTTAPKYLSKFNKIQMENDGHFLVGKQMTWADVYIAEKLDRLQETVDPTILKGYPHLEKFKGAVFSDPKIKAYIDSRPDN